MKEVRLYIDKKIFKLYATDGVTKNEIEFEFNEENENEIIFYMNEDEVNDLFGGVIKLIDEKDKLIFDVTNL